MIDIDAARTFMDTHARLIDRRAVELLLDDAPPEPLLTALAAYRNPDGGFGWALEPDLRVPGSQPVGALEALELLARIAPATSPLGKETCDWLDGAAFATGAIPFVIAGADAPGTAPWWAHADPAAASLHLTSAIGSAAHRVGRHDPAVAGHPWVARATDWALREIASRPSLGSYELMYVLRLLDVLAAADADPRATAQLERLAALIPPSGELPVREGSDDEKLRLLDISQHPGTPLRALLDASAVERALAELEAGQREDGGWTVDFPSSSPAAALEWRGIATLRALETLREHGRLAPGRAAAAGSSTMHA